MKKYFFFIAASVLMGGCDHSNHNHEEKSNASLESYYGEQFEAGNTVSVDSLPSLLANTDTVKGQFSGKIVETCSVKGCWMNVQLANGETMMVRMKDYGFFVPTSGAQNLNCTLNGFAFTEEIPVEDLKHYAEDAGKSEEEIAAITEPKKSISFMADGIMIEGYDPAKATEESEDEHDHHHHEGDGHDHHEGDGHTH